MAIAIDATSKAAAGFTGTSPMSWSHTCTGSNLIIWVGTVCTGAGSNAITAISYNSVAMTRAKVFTDSTNGITVSLYYLLAPATGSHTVSVTWNTATGRAMAGFASSFSGVAQTGQPDAVNSNNGTNSGGTPQPSVAVTTVADNSWIVDCVGVNDDSLLTQAAGQTKVGDSYDGPSTFPAAAMSYKGPKTPAGLTTLSWTGTVNTDSWVDVGASFAPAATSFIPPSQAPILQAVKRASFW